MDFLLYLDVVHTGPEDDVGDGQLDGRSEQRSRWSLFAAVRGGALLLVTANIKSPPQSLQWGFGGWEGEDEKSTECKREESTREEEVKSFKKKEGGEEEDRCRTLTFNQGFSVAMTQLTNQVVEMTRKTWLTASLLFGIWMKALEWALKRRRRKKETKKKWVSKIQVCRRRKVGRLENEKKNEEKVQKVWIKKRQRKGWKDEKHKQERKRICECVCYLQINSFWWLHPLLQFIDQFIYIPLYLLTLPVPMHTHTHVHSVTAPHHVTLQQHCLYITISPAQSDSSLLDTGRGLQQQLFRWHRYVLRQHQQGAAGCQVQQPLHTTL